MGDSDSKSHGEARDTTERTKYQTSEYGDTVRDMESETESDMGLGTVWRWVKQQMRGNHGRVVTKTTEQRRWVDRKITWKREKNKVDDGYSPSRRQIIIREGESRPGEQEARGMI